MSRRQACSVGKPAEWVGGQPGGEGHICMLLMIRSLPVDGCAKCAQQVDSMRHSPRLALAALGQASQNQFALIDQKRCSVHRQLVNFLFLHTCRMLHIRL
ncbi:hypothetical protein Mapa_015609 [Marchantia paleacea]|nr:hypothetical protein Mapa_015609 [Marchantia paleacea]